MTPLLWQLFGPERSNWPTSPAMPSHAAINHLIKGLQIMQSPINSNHNHWPSPASPGTMLMASLLEPPSVPFPIMLPCHRTRLAETMAAKQVALLGRKKASEGRTNVQVYRQQPRASTLKTKKITPTEGELKVQHLHLCRLTATGKYHECVNSVLIQWPCMFFSFKLFTRYVYGGRRRLGRYAAGANLPRATFVLNRRYHCRFATTVRIWMCISSLIKTHESS